MSPAGYWPQLHAAVEAGADSVYFGLKHFTARAKVGFSIDELPEVMGTLHRRGVRGFVTFNTLVFDHEIEEAAKALARIAQAGADAIIVQDIGILKLARRIAPELEIHASTQMSVTEAEGARLAVRLGASRVTLARELSVDQIAMIARAVDVELEVFVHGALCVAYSGQCLSSEAWGGRSANRGLCAQACRLPYELVVDGQLKPLGDARYLLSPNDLMAIDQIPQLIDLGLAALKIEGRYKESDYVAAATSAYRKAVDDAWAARPLTVTESERLDLEQVYSRGMGAHFITGTNHQAVVTGRAPRHRGVLVGEVLHAAGSGVLVKPAAAHAISPLKAGDGIVFDAASWRSPQDDEEGGRVFEVLEMKGGNLELRFGRNVVRASRIRPGDLVWRTDDPVLERRLRIYTQAKTPVRRQRTDVAVTAREGQPLASMWTVGGHSVFIESASELRRAETHGLTVELLREQFGRLGGTAYELGKVTLELQGEPFAPASVLNQVRREAVEALERLQAAPRRVTIHDPTVETAAELNFDAEAAPRGESRVHLLVRAPEQLDAAIEAQAASVTLDYLDLFGLKPAVERVVASGTPCRVASPRILKPDENRTVDFLLRLGCPILVRSAGLLELLLGREGVQLTGDFSLNAANTVSARLLLHSGLDRLTPSHDLNAAQIAGLARSVGGARIEAVVYQHLPVFHTEHCVFARFLSSGKTYLDCGRPCEKHQVELRDDRGRAHPVLADVGCRNTVFSADAQQASARLKDWMEAGIRHFRIEFTHESAEQVRAIAAAFADALARRIDQRELAARLKRASPGGLTEGSLYVAPGYLELPVLQ